MDGVVAQPSIEAVVAISSLECGVSGSRQQGVVSETGGQALVARAPGCIEIDGRNIVNRSREGVRSNSADDRLDAYRPRQFPKLNAVVAIGGPDDLRGSRVNPGKGLVTQLDTIPRELECAGALNARAVQDPREILTSQGVVPTDLVVEDVEVPAASSGEGVGVVDSGDQGVVVGLAADKKVLRTPREKVVTLSIGVGVGAAIKGGSGKPSGDR